FHPIDDFAPISTLSRSPQVLVLHPSLPAKSVRELVALASSKPGQLNYASYGTGSASHLGAELFSIITEVKMQHIPYKGPGPAINELLAGEVQLFFTPPAPVIPHVTNGRLKAIAVSSDSRLSVLPHVETFAEAG